MKRWLVATVGVLAMVGTARADKGLDDAVAKLSSHDRAVRQAAVLEIQSWTKAFMKRLEKPRNVFEDEAVEREYLAARPHWHLICCEDYIGEVVEALADPRPNSALKFLRDQYKDADGDRPVKWGRDDEMVGVCGTGLDRSLPSAIRYVVSKRPDVARALIADPSFGSRGALLRVLTGLRHPEDQAVAMRLTGSPNPSLRASAVLALSEYPAEGWLTRVLPLTEDRDPEVRYAVAWVLGHWEGERPRSPLLTLLQDPYRKVAQAASEALSDGEENSPELERAYLQVLQRHPHWDFALHGLVAHATDISLGALLRHWKLKGAGWEDVPEIVGKIDSREGRKLVLDGARSRDPEVRERAIKEMSGLVGHDVEDAILAALGDRNENVKSAALDAVQERRLPEAIPILRAMVAQGTCANSEEVKRVLNLCLAIPERNKH